MMARPTFRPGGALGTGQLEVVLNTDSEAIQGMARSPAARTSSRREASATSRWPSTRMTLSTCAVRRAPTGDLGQHAALRDGDLRGRRGRTARVAQRAPRRHAPRILGARKRNNVTVRSSTVTGSSTSGTMSRRSRASRTMRFYVDGAKCGVVEPTETREWSPRVDTRPMSETLPGVDGSSSTSCWTMSRWSARRGRLFDTAGRRVTVAGARTRRSRTPEAPRTRGSGEGGAGDDGGGDAGGGEGGVDADGPTGPSGDDVQACGCTAAPSGSVGLALVVSLLGLWRRRAGDGGSDG